MAKSQQSFEKNEKEKKRLKKQAEKRKKREERKQSSGKSSLDDMIAYVDENGNIVDTPPDLSQRTEIDASTIELGIPKREKEEISSERHGIVEFFNHSKGFGFIKDLATGDKVFVHVHGVIDEITEGNRVMFEVEQGKKGPIAVNVKKE